MRLSALSLVYRECEAVSFHKPSWLWISSECKRRKHTWPMTTTLMWVFSLLSNCQGNASMKRDDGDERSHSEG